MTHFRSIKYSKFIYPAAASPSTRARLVTDQQSRSMENKVFGQGGKVGETDKLNIDSIIARLLEGEIKCLYLE